MWIQDQNRLESIVDIFSGRHTSVTKSLKAAEAAQERPDLLSQEEALTLYLDNSTKKKQSRTKNEALLAYISEEDPTIDEKIIEMGNVLRSRKRWETKKQLIKNKTEELEAKELTRLERAYVRDLAQYVSKNKTLKKQENETTMHRIQDSLFGTLLRFTKEPAEHTPGTRLSDAVIEATKTPSHNKLNTLTEIYSHTAEDQHIRQELLDIGQTMLSRKNWYTRLERIDGILDETEQEDDLNSHEKLYISQALDTLHKNRAINRNALLNSWAKNIRERMASWIGEKYADYRRKADALHKIEDKIKELKKEDDPVSAAIQAQPIFNAYGIIKQDTEKKAPLADIPGLTKTYKSIERNYLKIIREEDRKLSQLARAVEKKGPDTLIYDGKGRPLVDRENYQDVTIFIDQRKSRRMRKGFSFTGAALAFIMMLALGTGRPYTKKDPGMSCGSKPAQAKLINTTEKQTPPKPVPITPETDEQICDRTLKTDTNKIKFLEENDIDEVVRACIDGGRVHAKLHNTEKGIFAIYSPFGKRPYRQISGFDAWRPAEPLLKSEDGSTVICHPRNRQVTEDDGKQACVRKHYGVDLVPAEGSYKGTQLYSMMPGKVIQLGKGGKRAGTYAVVEHELPDGTTMTTKYVHLQGFSPQLEEAYNKRTKGRRRIARFTEDDDLSVMPYISGGQPIGPIGRTGNARGVHLHLETRVDGRLVDPEQYLPHGQQIQQKSIAKEQSQHKEEKTEQQRTAHLQNLPEAA